MRITYVAPRSWPSVGGAQSFLRHVSRALAERHEVRVLALSIGDERPHRLWESVRAPRGFEPFSDDGVHVEHLRLAPIRRAFLAPLVAQVVPGLRRYTYGNVRRVNAELYARTLAPLIAQRAAGTDVVHMWGTGLLGAAALRASHLLDVPCVITPFAHRGQWGDDATSAQTYRRAERVLALLGADAALYRELGVAPERVTACGVCSPGVARGGGEELRRRKGIDGPIVLFLGVRRPYKGVGLLLDAAASLPHVTFAFVGPGAPVEGENILDAGIVDDVVRAAWLDAADLLCLPSEAEIFPSSILEAWSAGTPVLTSEIAPLHELVSTTGGGATAPRDAGALAARIRELTASPKLLAALGAAGRRAWESRFTPSAVAARHEQVYHDVVRAEARAA